MSPAQALAKLPLGSVAGLRRLLVFAMTVVGYGSLQFSGELPLLLVPVFGAAVLVAWWWREGRVNFARWKTPWTVLTLAMFAITIFRVATAEEFDLTPGVHFAIFLATAKLFQLAEDKDYPQSMALSLVLLASGTALNDQLSFGVMFGIYVFVATLALTVNHLSVEVSDRGGDVRRTRMERAILWSTLGLSALVFVGAVGFFFTFPRIGFGFFMQQNREGLMASGFGDDVELGGHGTIREDATVVMRVTFPDGPPFPPGELYFRGLSLDHFTGRGWRDQDDDDRAKSYQPEGPGYLLWPYTRMSWEEATEDAIEMNVYLEPIGSDVLFSIGRPRAIGLPDDVTDLPEHVFGRDLDVDRTGQVTLRQRSSAGTQYRMWSRVNIPYEGTTTPLLEGLRAERYSDEYPQIREAIEAAYRRIRTEAGQTTPVDLDPLSEHVLSRVRGHSEGPERRYAYLAERYLQLPDGHVTDRMQALVDGLRAQAPLDVDYARAVRDHLHTFTYTTDLPMPSEGQNLTDAFLFEWQEGHCEYYATAMAVLMRAGGVPARVVNGFLGADYNQVGDYWSVRQANAHSWVEVYFPESGWVRFDPTPAGAPDMGGSGLMARVNMLLDSLRFLWFRWVIEYDLEKQVNAVRNAVEAVGEDEGSRESSIDLGEWIRWAARWLGPRIVALVLLSLGWLVAAALLRRRALERYPWSRVDWAIAAGWLAYGLLVIWARWPSRAWLSGVLVAVVPIIASVWIARELRAGLFDSDDRRRGRSRGGDLVSSLYARLLATVEQRRGDLPMSVTARELAELLSRLDDETAAEVRDFLLLYERVRFAGEPLAPDEEAALRKRFRRLRRRVARAIDDAEA